MYIVDFFILIVFRFSDNVIFFRFGNNVTFALNKHGLDEKESARSIYAQLGTALAAASAPAIISRPDDNWLPAKASSSAWEQAKMRSISDELVRWHVYMSRDDIQMIMKAGLAGNSIFIDKLQVWRRCAIW